LARASKKGFKNVFIRIIQMPNNSVSPDLTKDDGKKEQAAREKNVMAYEDLILSIDTSKDKGKIAFQIVKTSKTSELKGGMLHWHGSN